MSAYIPVAAVAAASLLAAGAALAADSAVSLPTDLGGYRHINSLVVPNPTSPISGIHHFYIGETGRLEFLDGLGGKPYPAGTTIVGKVFTVTKNAEGNYKEGDIAAYTMMVKRPDDPKAQKTGGWRFAMFDSNGKPKDIDPVSACFGCHKPHAGTDYVISRPLGGIPPVSLR
ncbi:MAG TPA: cytochrome P460 family protein [Pelomicrobium sp.]|nr:cytochrome P460 family protein [Pelomicrobium sp.]